MDKTPRLSARALIVQDQKLLLVNALPGDHEKWCAPGGGVDIGENLRASLKREIFEETGLDIDIGDIAAVSEYFDQNRTFHQVDIFFKAQITGGELQEDWRDKTDVVQKRDFFSLDDIQNMDVLPTFLKSDLWLKESSGPIYQGFEDKKY